MHLSTRTYFDVSVRVQHLTAEINTPKISGKLARAVSMWLFYIGEHWSALENCTLVDIGGHWWTLVDFGGHSRKLARAVSM